MNTTAVVTVQTMNASHAIHDPEAVGQLLIERLPDAIRALVQRAAPEVFVTVVGVELDVLEAGSSS